MLALGELAEPVATQQPRAWACNSGSQREEKESDWDKRDFDHRPAAAHWWNPLDWAGTVLLGETLRGTSPLPPVRV